MGIYRKGQNWFIDFYSDGRRRREKVGASKSLANEVLAKRLAERAERRFFPERTRRSVSFRSFLEKYWERHWRYLKGKGGASIKTSLLGAFGSKALDRVTTGMIQDYYNRKRDATSAATANRHLARLAHLFGCASKWKDYAGPNPTAGVEKGREANHRTRYLSKEEVGRLLSACSGRLRPIVLCAIYTGMRRGELLALRWENVNLQAGIIHIPDSKSGKPREVPIAPQVASALESLAPRREGPVFEMPDISVKRHFKKALDAAGIQGFRFHDLRHTFASHFVMSTGDLPALQRILGHYSLKMTQRYAHLSKGHLAREIKAFSEGFALPEAIGGAGS